MGTSSNMNEDESEDNKESISKQYDNQNEIDKEQNINMSRNKNDIKSTISDNNIKINDNKSNSGQPNPLLIKNNSNSLIINKNFDNNENNNIQNSENISNINRKKTKKLIMSQYREIMKMEMTNKKNNLSYRKYKFNGITVVQNLKDYLPDKITKDEIKYMIYTALGEGLIEDEQYYIPGKTVTKKQVDLIVELIENYIKYDDNIENLENDDILNGVNLSVDLVDINKDIIREKMFKGKNPSDIQLDNTLKNLTGGLSNVKLLNIEFH